MHDILFLLSKGIEFKNLNDMWTEYWDSLSIPGEAFNDRMFQWLGSIGYTGSYSDRYSKWVKDTIVILPTWWEIPTLDAANIVDAWDFGWEGHKTTAEMPVGFVHGNTFTNRSGNPSYRLGRGIYVGGAGSLNVPTTGLDWNEVSVIIELSGMIQNGTLDALFSHYMTDESYFTLQNDFPNDQLRWSCGDTGETVEGGTAVHDGVIGVSGTRLFQNGQFVAELTGTASAIQDIDFVLGAIQLIGTPNTQYSRGTFKKIMIVDRRLTDEEQFEVYSRMVGTRCDKPSDEYIDNWDFNCGVYMWRTNPSYPATITNNLDGSVHLKTDSQFGSLVPKNNTFDNADWFLKCKVRNVVGTGKLSIRRSNGQWFSSSYFTADGEYSLLYSGDIIDINVGAADDPTFEADYDYISLKKVPSNAVTHNGEPIFFNGAFVTYTPQ